MNKFVISFVAAAGLVATIAAPAHAHDDARAKRAAGGPAWVHISHAHRFEHAQPRYDRERRDWHRYDGHHHKYWRRLLRAHDRWHRRNDHRWDRHYRRDHARLHRELGLRRWDSHDYLRR